MNRAERKEERRRALLDGALAVLATHGLEGFTTGRIAAEAGIGQSAFYLYWPDREACLAEVATHVGVQVLGVIREARRASGRDPAQLPRSFADALRALVEHRAATGLFLRFRREPGPMGDLFRGLQARGTEELRADLVALGMIPEGEGGARLARYTVALVIGAVEGLLDGDLGDPEAVAGDLSRIAASALGSW